MEANMKRSHIIDPCDHVKDLSTPGCEDQVSALRQALIDGENSGDAGPLDMQTIANEARHDQAIENWPHEQVGSAFDALKADPSRALTVEQVRARLAAEHDKLT
jgi:antitoxin ParD1/3/4